jgi:hypothetical protein
MQHPSKQFLYRRLAGYLRWLWTYKSCITAVISYESRRVRCTKRPCYQSIYLYAIAKKTRFSATSMRHCTDSQTSPEQQTDCPPLFLPVCFLVRLCLSLSSCYFVLAICTHASVAMPLLYSTVHPIRQCLSLPVFARSY